MTTYRLPPEPEGPVWGYHPATGEWVKFINRYDLWVREAVRGIQTGYSWSGLLAQGEVTTIKPIEETLDELAEQIVSRARMWHLSPVTNSAELRDAVGRYNRKLHQLNDEKENT